MEPSDSAGQLGRPIAGQLMLHRKVRPFFLHICSEYFLPILTVITVQCYTLMHINGMLKIPISLEIYLITVVPCIATKVTLHIQGILVVIHQSLGNVSFCIILENFSCTQQCNQNPFKHQWPPFHARDRTHDLLNVGHVFTPSAKGTQKYSN